MVEQLVQTIKDWCNEPAIISNTFLKNLFLILDSQLIKPESITPILEFLSISANCLGTAGNVPFFFCAILYLNIKWGKSKSKSCGGT